jgi:polar amino acid transport system substrate-binding protein
MTRYDRRDLLKASLGTGLLLTAAPFIARRAWADETTFQQAQRTKSITVGVANEKPYGYVDTDNKATGAIVEVLRATLAPYGITDVQAQVGAFDTLIPGLLAKRFDVIGAGMYIKPKRCQQIAFSNPLTQAGGAFAAKKGNPKNLHSLTDVAKDSTAKIGTQLGTSQVTR